MKNPHPDELPSKSRMLAVLAISIVGYLLLEFMNVFVIKDLSPAGKLLCNRAGIVFGYLGALVGGLSFYWDLKADQLILWATQQRERAQKTALETTAQVPQSKLLYQDMEGEIARAQKYLEVKPWLGKLAIGFVVLSGFLQLISATDS